ncbi:MAG TPA: nitroreductase family deazaflavin-dependent oxidoreductase [Terriglobales bacterium]|nr:nitroreductase family deazaflavin-dependent oxidoreductase [Terriglobales bacterium]
MTDHIDPAYLYLTTTGRRSRLPREVEIWFTCRNGLYYVIAEFATSQWVRNVRANPQVEVRVQEKRFAARARIVDAAAEAELHAAVQQLSREKYGWGDGVVVELKPESPQG